MRASWKSSMTNILLFFYFLAYLSFYSDQHCNSWWCALHAVSHWILDPYPQWEVAGVQAHQSLLGLVLNINGPSSLHRIQPLSHTRLLLRCLIRRLRLPVDDSTECGNGSGGANILPHAQIMSRDDLSSSSHRASLFEQDSAIEEPTTRANDMNKCGKSHVARGHRGTSKSRYTPWLIQSLAW